MQFVLETQRKPCTRGIWKILSMVQYLSNRITNPFMFGIILNSYLSSMLQNEFEMEGVWQAQDISP